MAKSFHTRSLTRMTMDRQWDKSVFENIEIAPMDTTMNKDYTEEDDIGKAIDQYFTKTRLLQKQAGHRLWFNNKEVQKPPDLEHAGAQQEEQLTLEQDTIPPGLEHPATYAYIHPTPKQWPDKTTTDQHNWMTSRSRRR
eukprot:373673-Amphidinium_carterae.3